jgi:hypothetical protein
MGFLPEQPQQEGAVGWVEFVLVQHFGEDVVPALGGRRLPLAEPVVQAVEHDAHEVPGAGGWIEPAELRVAPDLLRHVVAHLIDQ